MNDFPRCGADHLRTLWTLDRAVPVPARLVAVRDASAVMVQYYSSPEFSVRLDSRVEELRSTRHIVALRVVTLQMAHPDRSDMWCTMRMAYDCANRVLYLIDTSVSISA